MFEVCSLSTSIPHNLGLKQLNSGLTTAQGLIDMVFQVKTINLEGLKMILDNNTF